MNKEEIIIKKEHNEKLTNEELEYFFNGYLTGIITDEEMTKMLKAICKYELSMDEILTLTDIFIKSGDTIRIPDIISVDKHSTGGVGDKTTLILSPILASLDIYVAKMSGRALGYTGGTIDKLESIKGFKVDLSEEEFIKELKDIKMAITSQTKELCPLDKKVYALRDVTGTTSSISLIATSIMSKKIASPGTKIFIDVKVGNGALIKNKKDAQKLAKIMILIGRHYNRKVSCILTRMDNPLGYNIGNTTEVLETIDILNGKINNNLKKLVIEMSKEIVSDYKNISLASAKNLVIETINSKKAYNKFLEFVNYQHGDITSLTLEEGTPIYSKESGYIKSINALEIGKISMDLGAGRKTKEDKIDYQAGIILNKQVGDKIKYGELLCTIYGKNKIDIDRIYKAIKITKLKPFKKNIIIQTIK